MKLIIIIIKINIIYNNNSTSKRIKGEKNKNMVVETKIISAHVWIET